MQTCRRIEISNICTLGNVKTIFKKIIFLLLLTSIENGLKTPHVTELGRGVRELGQLLAHTEEHVVKDFERNLPALGRSVHFII